MELLRIRTLEGTPITIGDRTLVPQAQLVTCGRRRASVTRGGFGGQGWACGLLVPSGLIEQLGDRSHGTSSLRRIPISDRTAQALLAMAVVALAVALFCILVGRVLPGPWAARRGG
jgi:hypothetical protein